VVLLVEDSSRKLISFVLQKRYPGIQFALYLPINLLAKKAPAGKRERVYITNKRDLGINPVSYRRGKY